MAGKMFLLLLLLVPWELVVADEKIPLANPAEDRARSNTLDRVLGWGGYDDPRQSKVRATIHAGYHELQHLRTGNPREHERAKDQWGVVTGGARDNLARYDAQHFPSGNGK